MSGRTRLESHTKPRRQQFAMKPGIRRRFKTINTILFDWDGTLLDSAQSAFLAFQKSFKDLGIVLNPETYERVYSPNWYGMYEALNLPEHLWAEADERWTRYYGHQLAPLVPGGGDALQALASRGYSLGVVTSGSRSRVLREIEGLGLSGSFCVVVCNEDVLQKKPHPEGLLLAMERLDRIPESCCYVGDSPVDMEMGKRAGVTTVGIISAYPNSKSLVSAEPDLCFESIGHFVQYFLC